MVDHSFVKSGAKPRANWMAQAATPGCTKEACAFRDAYGKFKDAGAQVFGVSSDGVQANSEFAKVGLQPLLSACSFQTRILV